MAPRDFADTGAFGAGSAAGQQGAAPAAPPSVPTAPGAGPSAPAFGGGYGVLASSPGGGAIDTGDSRPTPPRSPPMNVGGGQDTTGVTPWVQQFLQQTGGFQQRPMGFAEGGAVPDEEEDYSGASAPVIGTEDSGVPAQPEVGAIDTGEGPPAPPQMDQQAPAGDKPFNYKDEGKQLLGQSHGPLAAPARGIKSIISYLMGADAMPPEALDGAGATVDPQGKMNPSERNLMALQHARDNGGDEAAWALMQSNRVAYNAQTSFAKAALDGSPKKPPDLMAAIDAANKAQANVLDGSHVEFAPLQGGRAITATVTKPGGQPDQLVLSPDQFKRWLDVGGDGQWDKVMSNGAQQSLHQIVNAGPSRGSKSLGDQPPLPGKRPAPGAAPAQAQAPAGPSESDQYDPNAPENVPQTNFGKTPSTLNLSGSTARSEPVPDQTNYGSELEARAMRMFPSVSQEAERNQFMAANEARHDELENKIGVAAEKGRNDREKAAITAGGRTEAERVRQQGAKDVAGIKAKGWEYASDAKKASAQIAADAKMAHEGNVDARQRLETARKAIATKRLTMEPLTADEKQLEQQITAGGRASSSPQAQAPQQRPQQQPQQQPRPQQAAAPGKPPVAGAKFFNGSWYTRGPNGESVPVQ